MFLGTSLLHHPPHPTAFWLATCSITAPSPPPPTLQPPPGSLGRQRAITMVIWTQITHTPVHCDWHALRWEGTKCHSNRFFCVFVFASILGGIVLRSMRSVTLEGPLERLWELGKQVYLRNEYSDMEMDCKILISLCFCFPFFPPLWSCLASGQKHKRSVTRECHCYYLIKSVCKFSK